MHPLVRRQLRKAFGDSVPDTAELRAFVAAVDDAYATTEAYRKQLEHSLELLPRSCSRATPSSRASSTSCAASTGWSRSATATWR